MFYLRTFLFLLFSLPMVSSGPGISTETIIKDAELNPLSSPKYAGTFPTPVHKDLRNMVPKDIEGFQNQPKDEYHINPSSKQELDNMLAYSEHFMPKLNEDSINLTSQRFEEIQAKYAKQEVTTQKNILRQWTWTDSPKMKNVRTRAFALMTQFVYAARYKLLYGQRLRAAYNDTIEYKIGYCFSLMRDMKQQQLSLYSTMHYNIAMHNEFSYNDKKGYPSFMDFGSYVALYEKIVRLDIDISDIINLVKEYEQQRLAVEATRPTVMSTGDDATDYSDDWR